LRISPFIAYEVIVAVAGAIIAYFQFVTARRKLMLDLFDRRLRMVEGIECAVGPFLANGKLTLENFNDLLTARAAARFLFDEDMQEHLNSLHRDFAFWLAHSDRSINEGDVANRETLIDGKAEVEMRLVEYPKNTAAKFGPYMKFTDKQTKPWLPW
jgi:hypothetical protein